MEDFTIGQRIAAKRKELGLSQIALGEQMGVSRQSISKWEADAAIPEIDKLIALSKLFGVSVGWLLGVEEDPAAEQENAAEFTDREWEIIDQLTQSQAKTPKWLVPLTAAATGIALFAVIIAGTALSNARAYQEDLAVVSQAIAILNAGSENSVSDSSMLESYHFLLEPSGDLSYCEVEFYGTPPSRSGGEKTELLIYADGKEVHREDCYWTGTSYCSGFFRLPVRNGYTVFFSLTDPDGIVRSTVLLDPDVNQMADAAAFGNVAVEFGEHEYKDGVLTLTNLDFTIDLPDLLRDAADLWETCDLVVKADGKILGRVDMLNRSQYSRQANFSKNHVDFYSQVQSVEIGSLSGFSRVELILDCGFNTGLEMQKSVHVWTVSDGKI